LISRATGGTCLARDRELSGVGPNAGPDEGYELLPAR
jgi:hypothetical protein